MANQVSSSAATCLVAPEVLAGDELEVVAGPDLDDGAAVARLVVDRDLLLVLGSGDLRKREIVAHGLVQTFIFSPRVLL